VSGFKSSRGVRNGKSPAIEVRAVGDRYVTVAYPTGKAEIEMVGECLLHIFGDCTEHSPPASGRHATDECAIM
jgi:hypothetical protein